MTRRKRTRRSADQIVKKLRDADAPPQILNSVPCELGAVARHSLWIQVSGEFLATAPRREEENRTREEAISHSALLLRFSTQSLASLAPWRATLFGSKSVENLVHPALPWVVV